MAYDCIDGWCDLVRKLDLDLAADGIDPDDAEEVATLALARIAELQRAETAARAMLAALENLMGYQTLIGGNPESSAMQEARAAIAAAEAAGITTTVEG